MKKMGLAAIRISPCRLDAKEGEFHISTWGILDSLGENAWDCRQILIIACFPDFVPDMIFPPPSPATRSRRPGSPLAWCLALAVATAPFAQAGPGAANQPESEAHSQALAAQQERLHQAWQELQQGRHAGRQLAAEPGGLPTPPGAAAAATLPVILI